MNGEGDGEEGDLLKILFLPSSWSIGASIPGLLLLTGCLVSELLQDVVHCCAFLDLKFRCGNVGKVPDDVDSKSVFGRSVFGLVTEMETSL